MSIIKRLFGFGPKKDEVVQLTPVGIAPIVTKDDVVQNVMTAPIEPIEKSKPAKVTGVKKQTPTKKVAAKKTSTRAPKKQ